MDSMEQGNKFFELISFAIKSNLSHKKMHTATWLRAG